MLWAKAFALFQHMSALELGKFFRSFEHNATLPDIEQAHVNFVQFVDMIARMAVYLFCKPSYQTEYPTSASQFLHLLELWQPCYEKVFAVSMTQDKIDVDQAIGPPTILSIRMTKEDVLVPEEETKIAIILVQNAATEAPTKAPLPSKQPQQSTAATLVTSCPLNPSPSAKYKLTCTGYGFDRRKTGQVYILFGNKSVVATFDSKRQVSCTIPALSTTGYTAIPSIQVECTSSMTFVVHMREHVFVSICASNDMQQYSKKEFEIEYCDAMPSFALDPEITTQLVLFFDKYACSNQQGFLQQQQQQHTMQIQQWKLFVHHLSLCKSFFIPQQQQSQQQPYKKQQQQQQEWDILHSLTATWIALDDFIRLLILLYIKHYTSMYSHPLSFFISLIKNKQELEAEWEKQHYVDPYNSVIDRHVFKQVASHVSSCICCNICRR